MPLLRYGWIVRTAGDHLRLPGSTRLQMRLAGYRKGEPCFRAVKVDSAETGRLQALAPRAVDQYWRACEDIAASWSAERPGRRT